MGNAYFTLTRAQRDANYTDGYRNGRLDAKRGLDRSRIATACPNLPGYPEGYTDGYRAGLEEREG